MEDLDLQMKFDGLKRRVKKIKVPNLAACVKPAAEKWGIKKSEIGHAILSNDEQYIGSVLTWKKQLEGSVVTFHGAFDPNVGRGIQTFLESQFEVNRFTAKEFWKSSEWILKNILIYSSTRKMYEGIEDGDDDDNEGFAVMFNVNNKKFIAADWRKFKAVLVSKGGNASEITGNNYTLPTISDLWHFRFHSSREGNLGMNIKKVKPGRGDSVILAGDGIWQVMGIQEAGHLILGTKDAQEASQVLMNEALTRNCKSNPSCIVIRFL